MQMLENQLCITPLYSCAFFFFFLLESRVRRDLLCMCEDEKDLRVWTTLQVFSPSLLPKNGKETFYSWSVYPVLRKGCYF